MQGGHVKKKSKGALCSEKAKQNNLLVNVNSKDPFSPLLQGGFHDVFTFPQTLGTSR